MAFTLSDNGTDDVLDVRDIIARVEQLESDRDELAFNIEDDVAAGRAVTQSIEQWEGAPEHATLLAFLSDIKGYGGDEEWHGNWYPVTLIRDSYFEEYARDLAEDIGAVNADATWPNNCIDWKQAARELQMDYTCATLDGVDFWMR